MAVSKILSLCDSSIPPAEVFEQAVQTIKEGGVIVVATETFYAVAASVWHESAVKRIFRIKGRPETKPLPLIAADRALVEELAADIPDLSRCLMDRFWPGSLTILIVPDRPMSSLLTGTEGKIGVRVPASCPARTVAVGAAGWITATSANLSGGHDPSIVTEIAQEILDSVDLVLDSGPAPGGKPSTLVEPFLQYVKVLRSGMVTDAAIEDFVADWRARRL